jgi:hypothetical protein
VDDDNTGQEDRAIKKCASRRFETPVGCGGSPSNAATSKSGGGVPAAHSSQPWSPASRLAARDTCRPRPADSGPKKCCTLAETAPSDGVDLVGQDGQEAHIDDEVGDQQF